VRTAFADTVGLLALWDRGDQWHEPAERAFRRLSQNRTALLTTSFILLECANAAARRPYRLEVDRLRAEMERGGFLVHPTMEDWRSAWAAYARGDADRAGVVDHVSFLVMRRLGIAHAFTNDRHFSTAGFEVLF
jgi:predicted nucleic acid-binding protein